MALSKPHAIGYRYVFYSIFQKVVKNAFEIHGGRKTDIKANCRVSDKGFGE
jgi:hypothetical protein